ncbi:DUF5801 repeats-in-toxin domain-containing protein [Halomonas sp.]|uniref:DUF5801 repeats-in-toxin domain-containing protein n=1 Tax=Halomonas sp. TaxID=1486246 RepID=UPI00298EC7F2|nr:DUF5801 repeats-in-toxin domain-containing protein [Halomonas sp.]MDW7748016.1 DUF5801 repeats-in-toxin domain-containing protein [Halomonas sp.]
MSESLVNITGTDVTHDETAGLQNGVATPTPVGDADDDDVLFSSIPLDFSSRLTALYAPDEPPTALGAAMSDGDVVTFNPTGELGNVALTGANGDPLDGDDSGLVTTDGGEAILLYTDTDNDNIVLGKTASGTLVFAIYLEETGGTPPTGGKLWTVQYEAIDHGNDGNDHDSAVDLTGLVHVTAFEAQTFSFENAPSGNNLFMAFGNASQALVITGENPANESEGENVSSGSTVNSSQGGGTTTLGIDGQQIKAQQAIVVTFVSGAEPDYLAGPGAGNDPGQPLSPTEALDEANIQFSGYVLAQAAEFTISQMTPGKSNTTTSLEIHAYLTADGSGNDYIDSNLLVQGDLAINITTDSVEVLRGGVDVVGTLGVSVDYDGDGVVVTGVQNGDVVRYETDADHNRVLIRNDQPEKGAGSNVAFDLGGFTLTEVAGDTDEVGSKIFFEDDGPSASANATVLLDDDALAGGNPGGVGDDADAANTSGTLGHSFGADGAGSIEWLTTGAPAGFSYALNGTDLEISQNGEVKLTLTVNATTGAYTVTQNNPIEHVAGNDENNQAFTVAYRVTDGDDDYVDGSIAIDVDDDTPTVDVTLTGAAAPSLTTQDAETIGAAFDTASGDFSGLFGLTQDEGADDDGTPAALSYSLSIGAGLAATGLTSDGNDITLAMDGDDIVGQTTVDAVVTDIFRISVDNTADNEGEVTLTQYAEIDHLPEDVDGVNDNANLGLADGSILLKASATIVDGDNDSASDDETVDISDSFSFDDDTPVVTVEDASGTYQAGAEGDWSDLPGADKFKAMSVTLDSYTIGTAGTPIFNEFDPDPNISLGTVTEPDEYGNYVFNGSITADFTDDGEVNEQMVAFTLTFDPDDDTYRIDVDKLPTSTKTFDTSQGTLKAGGPDAVRTLLFGGEPPTEDGNDDIVFFGAVPTAVRSDPVDDDAYDSILDLVVRGEPDLTEGQIEALLPLPGLVNSGTQMNVSTAGIGINNNNLDGADEGAGTGAFVGTSITLGDESFVVNPETLVDSVTVYISSTVQGYDPATEDLYYTVYYADGSVDAPEKVTEGDLTRYANNATDVPKEARGGSSFTIEGGDKQIDAVQLTMGQGTVKIPIIAFTVEEVFEPEALKMDFTAELFDGDDDSAMDTFSVDFGPAGEEFPLV